MIIHDLEKTVLIEPATDADELLILSAFCTAGKVSHQLEKLNYNIKINLKIGWPGFLVNKQREGLLQLQNERPNHFSCFFYNGLENIHSKIYVWLKNNKPIKAFHGSANFTNDAFNDLRQKNTMEECAAEEALEYINSFKPYYMPLEDHKRNQKSFVPDEIKQLSPSLDNNKTISLSLLARNGEIHERDGLNWGQPDGTKRRPYPKPGEGNRPGYDEAVIRIPTKIHKQNPHFFPEKDVHFIIETDDGELFWARTAQDNRKSIQTPKVREQNNATLGRYFRKRLGVPLGNAITKNDLIKYGRTDVTITKLDDDCFTLDFSKNN